MKGHFTQFFAAVLILAAAPLMRAQSAGQNPSKTSKIAAIAVAVLLVAGVCLGMAAVYLRTNERGPSVAAVQTKSLGLDGAESTLGH